MSGQLLEIEHASVLRGDRLILDDLSLTIAEGQHCAILGRNGSGKSTLVQLVARQLYPLHGGTVRIFGRESWPVHELRQLIGIVSPGLQSDFTGAGGAIQALEVFDAVASGFFAARGLWRHHDFTDDMHRRTQDALRAVGAEALVGRDMGTLSTGEARRVLIARALVHRPRALLLDEPCAGLDPTTRRAFLETLRGLARSGTTLILVTHHVEEILPEIEHVALLRAGQLAQFGPKKTLLTADALLPIFDAPIHVERHGGWHWARLD